MVEKADYIGKVDRAVVARGWEREERLELVGARDVFWMMGLCCL